MPTSRDGSRTGSFAVVVAISFQSVDYRRLRNSGQRTHVLCQNGRGDKIALERRTIFEQVIYTV